MKILFTGGGTGGHFYPIIAVAESVRKIAKEQKLLESKLYYMGPSQYDEKALFENSIIYINSYSGKIRRYFSILNFFDLFKTAIGVLKATFNVWRIFPDIIFAKGGYASFPTLFAAKILGIPVIIHESDSHPGRVSLWASKFAKKIALSYENASVYFPQDKIAFTGNPIRKEIQDVLNQGAREFLGLDSGVPVILILGGSQGSQHINEAIIGILPELVKKYYVIHQTGKNNFDEINNTANVVLKESLHGNRYKPFPYLNTLSLRMAAGEAAHSGLIISRAGSTIFEIALWQSPSIIIPIPEEISHDQKSNAFAYAASGACSVIEEMNLTSNILMSEIERIMDNPNISTRMRQGAAIFGKKDAADTIAKELIRIALTHTNN